MISLPEPKRPGFTLHGRLRSFGFALSGMRYLFRSEHNMWLHLAAAIAAVGLAAILRLPAVEWLWIVAAIGWVWSAEAFNTAVERLADAVTQEWNVHVGLAKDLAAAGVLISAMAALSIGLIVFVPRLIAFG